MLAEPFRMTILFREGSETVKMMTIGTFQAHALQVIVEVAKTKESLGITVRSKKVAQALPYVGETSKPVPGKLADVFVSEKDSVSAPGSESWEATK